MYKEYLAEFWYSAKALENSKVSFSIPISGIYGEVGVNTFRNATGAHYLRHSSEYVAPPSIDIVRPWFETIGHGKTVPAKGTLKRVFFLLGGEGCEDGEVTPYPTQIFSVNNWALKTNQPEGPPFTNHMLAICSAAKLVVFKAPKPYSNAERVSQGKLGAQPEHKKHSTSLKQPYVSSQEATKGGSFKASTGSKTSHFKRKKDSSSTMESNPNQTLASNLWLLKCIKRTSRQLVAQILYGSPVKKEQTLSSVVSASGYDASANFTTEADLEKYAPSDFIPQQQGMNEETKSTSYDHLFAGTDQHVFADQPQSVSEGLETVPAQCIIDKGASNITKQI
ncbi:hypothetical protein Tco_1299263, partial [Tanacetum coccineum]